MALGKMVLNKMELPAKRKSQTWGMLLLALVLAGGLAAAEPRTIVFFGDSITAGYGLDPEEAFPALIQQRINAAGLAWRVTNAGLSGETSAGGRRRLDWILKQPVDIFVLELGGNDGLRGLPLSETRLNLQAIIDGVHARYPKATVVMAGMRIPPNLGPDYTNQFSALFAELARANHAQLIPFLLESVGGLPALNQADGIHPNAAGHKLVADTVWKVLQPLL